MQGGGGEAGDGLTPDGPSRLVVAGFDKGQSFNKGTDTKTYKDVKDSDLAQQIAQRNGLQADVEDSKVVDDYVLQNNVTDYDFLMQRAALAGYRFMVDDKKLTFKTPQVDGDSVATLTWMQNIGRFVQEVNTFDQVSKVTPTGWDSKQKQAPTPQQSKGGDELARWAAP